MTRNRDYTSLLALAGAVTMAFAWILWPYFGALFWAIVLAIVFDPLFRRLLTSLGGRPTAAALATIVLIVLIVILPLLLVAAALAQEASNLYARVQSGEISFAHVLQPLLDALPGWATRILALFGLSDLGSVRERLTAAMTDGIQATATQALAIGQGTFGVIVSLGVMLYMTFFLLRDGARLVALLKTALPMGRIELGRLLETFTVVIRATVKGDLLVAILQGASGGLIFTILGIHASLLWAVLMAFTSLLPAIGAALIWLPVALYLLTTGATWQGVSLIVYGVLVIGLVDNLVRPMLVGKDTRMPDYVVLISTLGGVETFGLHGFIIGPVIAALFLSVWTTLSTPVPAAGDRPG